MNITYKRVDNNIVEED